MGFNINDSSSPSFVVITGETLELVGATPRIYFEETDQGADGKLWDIVVSGGVTAWRTRTDANDTGQTWLSVARSGTTVSSVTLPLGSLILGTADTASGHLNAYENMTFNMDIDNDDTNRTFGWYINAADGGGTLLMSLDEAGVLSVNAVSGGGIQTRRVVEANTAGSGSPNILATSEVWKVFTNEGTTAENYHTLPAAAAGLTYTFYCQDADGIRATAVGDDTIRLGATVSAAAGFISSTTIGSSVTLVAVNATQWVAVSIVGTWTVT